MSLFIPNTDFPEEIASDPDTKDGLKGVAEAAKPAIEAAARSAGAPWMPRPGRETIEVVEADEGVYIVNTDYAAHLQEYGSINNPPYAPLRRGASTAGLRVEETPKT